MDTNKLLVFVAGAAVGAFALNMMMKNKKATPMAAAPDCQSKWSDCENKWVQMSATVRYGSEADMLRDKYETLKSCFFPNEAERATINLMPNQISEEAPIV